MESEQTTESESYPTDYFTDHWKFWIWDNIVRVGCKKDVIVDILLKKNFSYDLINQELSYDKYLSEQEEIKKKNIQDELEKNVEDKIDNDIIVEKDKTLDEDNSTSDKIE